MFILLAQKQDWSLHIGIKGLSNKIESQNQRRTMRQENSRSAGVPRVFDSFFVYVHRYYFIHTWYILRNCRLRMKPCQIQIDGLLLAWISIERYSLEDEWKLKRSKSFNCQWVAQEKLLSRFFYETQFKVKRLFWKTINRHIDPQLIISFSFLRMSHGRLQALLEFKYVFWIYAILNPCNRNAAAEVCK